MQSPPLEWGLGIGYLVALDVLRDHGEPDDDTLSECTRAGFRVETRRGRIAWRVALVVGVLLLDRHICKPEMRHRLIPPAEIQET